MLCFVNLSCFFLLLFFLKLYSWLISRSKVLNIQQPHCIHSWFVIIKVKLKCDHFELDVSVGLEGCLTSSLKCSAMIGSSCHSSVRYWNFVRQIALSHFDVVWQFSFYVLSWFFYLFIFFRAPTFQIKTYILWARQLCQVISCAIVGGVISSDGQ